MSLLTVRGDAHAKAAAREVVRFLEARAATCDRLRRMRQRAPAKLRARVGRLETGRCVGAA
jgi:hypothetical protein